MPENFVIQKMKVAIVDDHELVREGMNVFLSSHGIRNVEKFRTAGELMARLRENNLFDFYIVDLELPDSDGFVLIESIRALQPDARIIVSTVHDEIWTLRKLLARNVSAIIYKSGEGSEIIEAMTEILKGNRYYCRDVRDAMEAATDRTTQPSTRELEVLSQIAGGKTSREIAASLFVSDNTVEAHRKALFQKLGAVNVADLIVKAIKKGYLPYPGTKR